MWATDRIGSLLFHRLLSQHPVLPTPEGSSRLLFQVLRRFLGLRHWLTGSAPSFSRLRANISTLQDSLYVAGCCFALLSSEDTTLRHTYVHRLPATWPPVRYQDWTFTSKQTMTFQDTRAGVGSLCYTSAASRLRFLANTSERKL
jgi:hypothetical protein